MKIIDINGNKRNVASASPDSKFPGYMKVVYLSKSSGAELPSEWYPLADFVKHNPKLKHLTKSTISLAEEVVGIVTSSGSNFIRDDTKNWHKDNYKGYPVWISRGQGEGQSRTIITNTKNTLTVNQNWETRPNPTSQYVISRNVHSTQPLGNTLPALEIEIAEPDNEQN